MRFIYLIFFITNFALATNIYIPTPLELDMPVRLGIGAQTSLHRPNAVAFRDIGAFIAFTHLIGNGFEWGLDFTGMAASSSNLFRAGDGVSFRSSLGIMGRYITQVGEDNFAGLQLNLQYKHDFHSKYAERMGAFDFMFGVPISHTFLNLLWLYAMPSLGLMDFTSNIIDTQNGKTVLEAHFGANLLFGAMLNVMGPWLFLQMQPGFSDISKPGSSFFYSFVLGVAFDF